MAKKDLTINHKSHCQTTNHSHTNIERTDNWAARRKIIHKENLWSAIKAQRSYHFVGTFNCCCGSTNNLISTYKLSRKKKQLVPQLFLHARWMKALHDRKLRWTNDMARRWQKEKKEILANCTLRKSSFLPSEPQWLKRKQFVFLYV